MAKSFLISSGSSNSPCPSPFTLKCFSNFLAPALSRSIELSPPDLRLAGHKRHRLRNLPRQMRDVSTVPSGVSSHLDRRWLRFKPSQGPTGEDRSMGQRTMGVSISASVNED